MLRRESTLQAGNDGLVILPDGTRSVSSARQGGITEIAPGKEPRLIVENLPLAASMYYDSGAKQLQATAIQPWCQ
ncbi:hypothetical protein GCM10025791_36800 [Halioxenophilus aromaticivorans]|uniref:Uncharacterized protein n=1 Tax=Halioxenophilus aromaticivorans TaxID=1306992 RepID=A0AAV3U6R4_9ALTE